MWLFPLLWWRSCRLLSVPSPKRLRRRCTAKSLSAYWQFLEVWSSAVLFLLSCWSWWEGGTHPFFGGVRLLFHWSFFSLLLSHHHSNVLKKTFILRCGVEFQKKKNRSVNFFLACHSGLSRSLVFLQNDWAQFVKDGWLASKGLCVCKIVFTLVYFLSVMLLQCCKNFVCECARLVSSVLYMWSLALFDPLWYKIGYQKWCFMLNMISLPWHPWMVIASASFLVSTAFTPVRNCLCAWFCAWVRQGCCSSRYTGGLLILCPQGLPESKMARFSFSTHLHYCTTTPATQTVVWYVVESIIVNSILFENLLLYTCVWLANFKWFNAHSTTWLLIWCLSKHTGFS